MTPSKKNILAQGKDLVRQVLKSLRYGKLRKKKISIVTNSCLAGFLYHEFGLQFQSPTINLQFTPRDFVKFCSRIEDYLHQEIRPVPNPDLQPFRDLGGETIDFPVGTLGDLVIYFQHYETLDLARKKWTDRTKRFHKDEAFYILVDTNCSQKVVEDFLALPVKHKLFMTGRPELILNDHCFLMRNMDGRKWFDINPLDGKSFYRQFDFYRWFSTPPLS